MPAKRPTIDRKNPYGVPSDVRAIRGRIKDFLDREDNGRKIGGCRFGVYVFYDYDREPIYVGQTYETLRQRIGRHLTNQRTDAVAMNVLDPFEVAEIEVWPCWDLADVKLEKAKPQLNSVEFTVFEKVLNSSSFGAVLNEKDVPTTAKIKLPISYRERIIPEDLYEGRKHPDVRIARRASTIASLARVISERKVSAGLRRTLVTQARRLERLASQRLKDFANQIPERQDAEEE
jgi:GIY-YIG catalytic domain-containing protein